MKRNKKNLDKICKHKNEATKWLKVEKDAFKYVNSFHRIDDTCI